MVELELRNITKDYDSLRALDALSFTFHCGIYGVLGENGAGKSTMFQLMTDNLKRQTGEILLNGQEILDMGWKYRKEIGYMPQQQGFYENMSAISFLKYIAYLKGMNRKEFKKTADLLLEKVHLSHVKYKRVGGLSGGMKQRLLIACTLLSNPSILFLDEPTAGLDPKERIELRNFMKELGREKIILIATHVVSDVESIADCILILKQGKIVAHGEVKELLTQFRTDNLENVYLKLFSESPRDSYVLESLDHTKNK